MRRRFALLAALMVAPLASPSTPLASLFTSLASLSTSLALLSAKELFTTALPPEEFEARRAALITRLGDGVAILQGATEPPSYSAFRQNNHFHYLSGVEAPRAILVLDGAAKKTTLYLAPRNERMERSEGPVLVPGADASRLTGIADIRPRNEFAAFAGGLGTRTVYTPHRHESLGAVTPDRVGMHARATAEDPWDKRPSREAVFIAHLKQRAPAIEVKDLDPLLDEMRMIKSTREIALVREATRVAGEGIMEAIRSARVGMREYELEAIADYFFKRAGSQGVGYYALVATGKNAFHPHYHAGRDPIKDGDLVLFDYAPDLNYYTADVTREFPASGTFTGAGRELYGVYLKMYQALMETVRPNVAIPILLREAASKMDMIVRDTRFTSSKHEEAARRFADQHRNARTIGHHVGMEVHDVMVPHDALKPGMIFTIEPALTIPEDRVYIRLEDMILVTEKGYENMSAFVPMEIADIEKLMAEEGLFERPVRISQASGR